MTVAPAPYRCGLFISKNEYLQREPHCLASAKGAWFRRRQPLSGRCRLRVFIPSPRRKEDRCLPLPKSRT
ncbi:hypothetical protein IE4771_CH01356 [Rhizobium etli bv. mimosae str. IE4771]|uniref:Uncharacterized protein n=1 Tax=Rhizobium etli bv. mimosae str. IE4771 TaxID=1432050 RepID=A0A060HY40_RHIET|nr:hypothetical protein IE4771_CH01356 [Rhizobium sp. IE4771]